MVDVERVRKVLARNLDEVRGRIAEAAHRAGRSPEEVTLLVVTKTVSPEVIACLPDLGVSEVGENRVQALLERAERLKHLPLRWHMIGHLQRNKARKAASVASLIHSLDSPRLADTLDRIAGEMGRPVEVLVQVNISGEESKFGLSPDEAEAMVAEAGRWTNLRIRGLMTMAPLVEDPEEVRPIFAALRQLACRLRSSAPDNAPLEHLSMGMTQDYIQAVEEGATIVRIGTAIFRGI